MHVYSQLIILLTSPLIIRLKCEDCNREWLFKMKYGGQSLLSGYINNNNYELHLALSYSVLWIWQTQHKTQQNVIQCIKILKALSHLMHWWEVKKSYIPTNFNQHMTMWINKYTVSIGYVHMWIQKPNSIYYLLLGIMMI